jgi:hypothetical protein
MKRGEVTETGKFWVTEDANGVHPCLRTEDDRFIHLVPGKEFSAHYDMRDWLGGHYRVTGKMNTKNQFVFSSFEHLDGEQPPHSVAGVAQDGNILGGMMDVPFVRCIKTMWTPDLSLRPGTKYVVKGFRQTPYIMRVMKVEEAKSESIVFDEARRLIESPQDPPVPQDKNGNDLVDLNGDPVTLNADGTLTLYHGTSAKSAQAIKRTGKWKSEEGDLVFFSNHPDSHVLDFGDTVVSVRLKPQFVELDDAFRDGEIHVSVHLRDLERHGKVLSEALSVPDAVQYHGTSLAQARKIANKGLEGGKREDDWAYVTPDIRRAEWYASEYQDRAIVEFSLSKNTIGRLEDDKEDGFEQYKLLGSIGPDEVVAILTPPDGPAGGRETVTVGMEEWTRTPAGSIGEQVAPAPPTTATAVAPTATGSDDIAPYVGKLGNGAPIKRKIRKN